MAEPKIGPDGLSPAYWEELRGRVKESLDRIVERQNTADVNGRTIPENEHLLIGEGRPLRLAVMFLDICGFSNWPSATAEEQQCILTVFNLFMSEMIRIARDYGGEIEKNTGDGLMAYFDLQPEEEDERVCKRAIACGLSMLATTHQLINPILRNSTLPEIKFRVGMDFGPVTIAKVGSSRLYNNRVAIGSIANVACKMLKHGGENQVLIGNELRVRLPEGWSRHVTRLPVNSGFIYVGSGAAYPIFKYTGRWVRLT